MKRLILFTALLGMASLSLYGCGSSSDTAMPENYTSGVMLTQPQVTANATKALQSSTADTHEVKTDGKWIVWSGRSINLNLFDGTDSSTLKTGLDITNTPFAFSYCDDSPIDFDGTTMAFIASDIATADMPMFYYGAPGSNVKGIEMAFATDKEIQSNYKLHVLGDFAVVSFEDGLYLVDLSVATPAFGDDVMPGAGTITGAGGGFIMIDTTAGISLLDISDGTVTAFDADTINTSSAHDIRYDNGMVTWVENGDAYYCDLGVAPLAAVALYGSTFTQTNPVAGPGYFLWNENGELMYTADGGATAEVVGEYRNAQNIEAGDGFFAYTMSDGDSYQLYVYDLSDLSATDGVAVTTFEDADEPSSDYNLTVDGSKVYCTFSYEYSAHIPSKVLVSYDFATDTLTKVTTESDYQQVPVTVAAGGKALFLTRDQNFRLFGKIAAVPMKPLTLTPASFKVSENFNVGGGVVAFKAYDRSITIDGIVDPDDYYGEDLMEVYFIDLDAAGDITRITHNFDEEQYQPMTDGEYVTYTDNDDDYYGWAYEIATGEYIPLGYSDGKITVDNGLCVWEESNDIYAFDLVNNEPLAVLEDANPNRCPDLANGIVSWGSTSDWGVYYADLNAETITATLVASDFRYGQVVTDGNYLAWRAYDTSYYNNTYSLADETTTEIPLVAGGTTADMDASCYPRISDGVVAFNSEEYGIDNPDGDKEIFYCDLTADTLVTVQLTNDPEGEGLWDSKLDIADGLIVWRTGGASSWDWRGKTVAAAKLY